MFERFTIEARAVVVAARRQAEELDHGHVGTEHLLLALAAGHDPVASLLRDRGAEPGAIVRERNRVVAEAGRAVDPEASGPPTPDVDPGGRPVAGDAGDPTAEEADRDALAVLGIDLDQIRRAAESAFGPGALDRARSGGGRRGPRRTRRHRGPDRPDPACGPFGFTPRAKKVLELSAREALRLKSRQITTGHLALGLLREGKGMGCLVLTRLGADGTELRRALESILSTRVA